MFRGQGGIKVDETTGPLSLLNAAVDDRVRLHGWSFADSKVALPI